MYHSINMAPIPPFDHGKIQEIMFSAMYGDIDKVEECIKYRETCGFDDYPYLYGQPPIRFLCQQMSSYTPGSSYCRDIENNLTFVANKLKTMGYIYFSAALKFVICNKWDMRSMQGYSSKTNWIMPMIFRRERDHAAIYLSELKSLQRRLDAAVRYRGKKHRREHQDPHIQAMSKLRASTLKRRLEAEVDRVSKRPRTL